MPPIPIIDLFAGPGGLGEGFTSVVDKDNNRVFNIALSIERDEFARRTLMLRSFIRQFPFQKLPHEYYQFIRGEIRELDNLYKQYPKEAEKANDEAWQFSLGNSQDHHVIDQRIREALVGTKNGEFLLIGGPPCQAYSLVGRSRRQEKEGLNKDDIRVYLYREYYRILAVHQPTVFIMENVKGLLSSKVENELVFTQLLNDLTNPVESYRKLHGKNKIPRSKYRYRLYSLVKKPYQQDLFTEGLKPTDFVIRAEDYGIPQARHRVVLLGIREDINRKPDILLPNMKIIPVEEVINGLPHLRSGLSKTKDGKQEWKAALNAIKLPELESQIEPDVWNEIERVLKNLTIPRENRGCDFIDFSSNISYNSKWYLDSKLGGVSNHQTRSHIINDLHRYLFTSCFAKKRGYSPKLSEFPQGLLPLHKNAKTGDFANRFKVQIKDQPSKTITSHISKDGHYFIHPDPGQCRSLTVREAARIQTFPDNYFFCGPRTQQFHQVGNAVPPLLAKQIAEIIKIIFKSN